MYNLIDRISGEEIGQISSSDFKVLRDVLVEENDDDTDYYVQQATLDFLAEAGLSPDSLNLLQGALEHRPGELELGWEVANQSPTAVVGKVRGLTGEAIPGVKVRLQQGEERPYWAFTRADGEFEVSLRADSTGTYQMQIIGLGQTEFWSGEIDVEADAVLDSGTFEINHNIHSRQE